MFLCFVACSQSFISCVCCFGGIMAHTGYSQLSWLRVADHMNINLEYDKDESIVYITPCAKCQGD